MKDLLAAGTQLLEAQREALAGRGTERFEAAGRRQRDTIKALVTAAAKLLADAGHRPGPAVEERIASSLRAASLDPEARRQLESGRLEGDVESSGLDLLAGMVAAGGGRAARAPRTQPRRDVRLREARDAVKAARETERGRRREAAEAEREAKRAAAAADEAAEQARERAAAADRAAEAVEEAEAELERLRRSK